MALQITAVLSTLVAPQLLGRLVGWVSAGRADAGYVDRIVLTIIAVTLVGALINRFAQKHARTLGESVFADLRERMMNRVVHLPLSAVESAAPATSWGAPPPTSPASSSWYGWGSPRSSCAW